MGCRRSVEPRPLRGPGGGRRRPSAVAAWSGGRRKHLHGAAGVPRGVSADDGGSRRAGVPTPASGPHRAPLAELATVRARRAPARIGRTTLLPRMPRRGRVAHRPPVHGPDASCSWSASPGAELGRRGTLAHRPGGCVRAGPGGRLASAASGRPLARGGGSGRSGRAGSLAGWQRAGWSCSWRGPPAGPSSGPVSPARGRRPAARWSRAGRSALGGGVPSSSDPGLVAPGIPRQARSPGPGAGCRPPGRGSAGWWWSSGCPPVDGTVQSGPAGGWPRLRSPAGRTTPGRGRPVGSCRASPRNQCLRRWGTSGTPRSPNGRGRSPWPPIRPTRRTAAAGPPTPGRPRSRRGAGGGGPEMPSVPSGERGAAGNDERVVAPRGGKLERGVAGSLKGRGCARPDPISPRPSDSSPLSCRTRTTPARPRRPPVAG